MDHGGRGRSRSGSCGEGRNLCSCGFSIALAVHSSVFSPVYFWSSCNLFLPGMQVHLTTGPVQVNHRDHWPP